MEFDILRAAAGRHTAKAYDPNRRIGPAELEAARELLRLAPSSVNLQPWRFIIAGTPEGKARVAKAAEQKFPFNAAAIRNCSHAIVFASLIEADDAYLAKILAQEERDGRFAPDPEAMKARVGGGRAHFVGLHQAERKDGPAWMARQLYLNLGQFLLGVAALGLDATPMEGVDTAALDAEFGLTAQGYAAQVVVTLGYADPKADYNAALPKSRLARAEVIAEI